MAIQVQCSDCPAKQTTSATVPCLYGTCPYGRQRAIEQALVATQNNVQQLTADLATAIRERDEARHTVEILVATERPCWEVCLPVGALTTEKQVLKADRDSLSLALGEMRKSLTWQRDAMLSFLDATVRTSRKDEKAWYKLAADKAQQALTLPIPAHAAKVMAVVEAARVAVSFTPIDGGFGRAMHELYKALAELDKEEPPCK